MRALFFKRLSVGILLTTLLGMAIPALLIEDGPVETTGAVLFKIAALLAIYLSLTPGRAFLDRISLIALSLGALLFALSEISFGARIFGWQMPEMKGGGELDGGHDLALVALRGFQDLSGMGQAVAAGLLAVALSLLARFIWTHRQTSAELVRWLVAHPARYRLLLAFGLLAFALVLDLLNSRRLSVLEEVLELFAAAALLCGVMAVRSSRVGLFQSAPTHA